MRIYFTEQQALHAPQYEFFRGQRVPCFENPSRADHVRAALQAHGLALHAPDVDSAPLLGEVHVASAMFFDTGVFLVVVGATMLALANLSRIARRAEYLPVNAEPMDIDPSLQSHSGQG